MSYDAGTSVGKYILQADAALKTQQQLIKGFEQLARAANFKPPSFGGAQITAEEVKLAQALARTAEAEARRASATAKRADADARAARTVAQTDLVEQKKQTELAKTAAAQDRAAVSAIKLGEAQARAAKLGQGGGGPALPRTFAGFTPQGLNQAAGAFGLATIGPQIVGQAINKGIEAGGEALALRETRNSLKAVSGDTKTYTTIIAEARRQQLLFGGSLSDITEGLSGFAVTARNTGAPLESLIDLQKRLTLLNPAQGAQGGLIALNEALAGNITSLSRRFNIPKAALQDLNDTTKPVTERLAVLDKFLTSVGITSAAVTDRVDAGAQAFRRLNQELNDAKLSSGNNLANFFERSATGLSRLIGLVNKNPQALAELKKFRIFGGDGGGTVNQADLDAAARQLAQEQAGAQLDPTRGQRGPPTAIIDRIGGPEAFHTAREQLTELILTGGIAADQATRLTDAFKNTQLGTTDAAAAAAIYRNGLVALLAEEQAGGSIEDRRAIQLTNVRTAQENAAAAAREHAAALVDNTTKSQASAIEAQKLAEFQGLLASLGDQVASGLITSGNAALSLSAQYGVAVEKARELVNAQAALASKSAVDVGAREFDSSTDLTQGRTAGIQSAQERAAAAQQARINQLLKTGTATQIVAERQKEYNDAVRQFGKDSAQAIDAQTTLIDAQQAAAKSTSPKGLSATDRADVNLTNDLNEQLKILLDKQSKLKEGSLAWKQIQGQILDIQQKIADQNERTARAQVDAALGAVKDKEARIKEARELAGLQRELNSNRFSEAEKNVARLEIERIGLEQQKRSLDIQKDQRAAGATPAAQSQQQAAAQAQQDATARGLTPPLPLPNVAQLTPQAPGLNLSLTIELNPTTGAATVVNPPAGVNVLSVLVKAAP